MQITITEKNGVLIASIEGRLIVGSEESFKKEMESYLAVRRLSWIVPKWIISIRRDWA